MKFLLVLIFLVSSTLTAHAQVTPLSKIRELYIKAAREEAAAEELLLLTEQKKHREAPFLGYYAAAHMIMAKHTVNPIRKLNYFNQGKELFSKAIKAYPQNVELRFLRFVVQVKTPGFLNYDDDRESDKEVLLVQTPKLEDVELKKMILSYWSTSKGVSDSEKEKLL